MKNKLYQIYICFFIALAGFAQTKITGVITDENNMPLPGVNVLVKNTTNGVMTDFEGQFSIEVNQGVILSISMVGMITQNIKVTDQTNLKILLKQDVAKLDEVVVIGYGSTTKKDLTGAVSTVKAEDLEVAPVATFDEALTGRIAGVTVTSDEGTPGAPLRIVVRGGNSLTGSNDPLYVVNGIPLEEFDPGTINTEDISSFQVLKDASATAIYGSRGANGVIVITTKSGNTDGTTNVNFKFSSGLQFINKHLEVLNPYQFVKHLETQAIARDGNQLITDSGSFLSIFLNRWGSPELYRDVAGRNYQEEAFREALMTRANFSVSGGNSKTNIFFSTAYLDQQGILITTGYKRLNTNFTIRHKINDKLHLRAAAWYTSSKRFGPPMRTSRNDQILRSLIVFRPVDPINRQEGEEEGGYIPGVNDDDFRFLFDPIKNLNNTDRIDTNNSIRLLGNLTYKINKNLTLKSANGYRTNIGKGELFYGLETQQGSRSENGINGTITNNQRTTISTSNTLQYKKRIRRSRLEALLGMEYVDNNFFSSRLRNTNLPTDKFGVSNLDIATRPTLALTNETSNKLMSFFGRFNFSLNNKRFLLTATLRADGSSKFQPENRWGYFPSFSGAWQIGDENFMSNLFFLNSLKLRAGWGLTGNNRIGDYISFNQFGITTGTGYTFGFDETYQPGAVQTTLAVPDLRWETTGQTNIGLDFSMFQSRFSGTIDYYYKLTDDLLLNANMSLSTGFSGVTQNIGSVSNEGLEVSLSGLIIDRENFKWETTFNISTNVNTIVALNDGQEWIKTDARYDFANGRTPEFHYISEIGQPAGMMYGFVYDGLFQVDDFVFDPSAPESAPYTIKDGLPIYRNGNIGPGHVKYVDQNGDGIIDQDDRTVIGNPHPKHFGGLNNKIKIRNFDIECLLQWSYDYDIFNANRASWSFPTHNGSFNLLSSAANAWTPSNTNTNIVTHYSNGAAAFPPPGYRFDSRYIEDGSFLRLKTVRVGFNVPMKNTKIGMKTLRIALSGQNLFTWTNYSGFDPEVSIRRSALVRNLDFSAYPQRTTYNVEVSAKF